MFVNILQFIRIKSKTEKTKKNNLWQKEVMTSFA